MTSTADPERSEGPERFAALLRSLKERSGLSYEALAQRTGSSRSTLHRYCSGSYVPPDYGPVHRFALICGASPHELRELHRLWAVADMSRIGDGGNAGDGRDTGDGGDTGGIGDEEEAAETVADGAPPANAPTGTPWRRRALPVLGVCFLLLVAGGTWMALATRQRAAAEGKDGRLLFSAACAEPVGMGQHDSCVEEVQRLLAAAGADIDVDSSFGPQTLRRVTAFQVLHGLDADGVVGAETKEALYSPKARIRSWSPEKVRKRIRQVFTEEPDHAVAIADCQSFLDPLHILPNTNGTRNWGVFQISDARLPKLGGTPRKALDPEWNIRAAHRLWQRAGNFDDWPYCERAYDDSR
ncbi:helix-turn-helix domain-containing protein [Streptomyces brasiliscabiei]|uniref:Helix-turn-helix domain-containing protein n=1 Tax=Streptomyces brasiliscabiei TaxID=2736302 RepID=A0ABU8GSV8_9ACTN